jgi:DNA repair protein RadC
MTGKVNEATEYHLKIKDWPADERPREKLLKSGARSLSDAELLALLIGSGTGGITAVDIAKKLLVEHGGLAELASKNVVAFSKMKGIGPARSAKIAAMFEIGRRAASGCKSKGMKIQSPKDIVRMYGPLLRDLKNEVFKVVLLDNANRILRDAQVSEGILNASLVHPREVFKPAVEYVAAGVILLHNHPSGEAVPSSEDRIITAKLVRAGEMMDIPVLDHVILAGDGYFSFAKEGLLKT